uniref:Pinhead n=1 Tax=Latimeria chalumnae TaxID=7897 RepID=H3BD73_LATCH
RAPGPTNMRTFTLDLLQLNAILILYSFSIVCAGMLRQADRRNLFAERGCCKRQSHFIYIGQDISGSPVSIDVGSCRAYCGASQRSANSYTSDFLGFSKHTSMLELLRAKKVKETKKGSTVLILFVLEPSCPRDLLCEPTQLRVERVLLYESIREVEVIDECQCDPKPTECIRMPALKTFSPHSPFETVVDVGKCSNPTTVSGGFSCIATKFESVLVEAPNGVELIQAVENCQMKEKCYRGPYLEYYYEVTYNSNGAKEERLKEIDVGRCLGSCSSGNHCLLRDSRNRDQCLVWAEGSSEGCIPQDYETHTFRTRHGHIRSVFAIKTCKCQS